MPRSLKQRIGDAPRGVITKNTFLHVEGTDGDQLDAGDDSGRPVMVRRNSDPGPGARVCTTFQLMKTQFSRAVSRGSNGGSATSVSSTTCCTNDDDTEDESAERSQAGCIDLDIQAAGLAKRIDTLDELEDFCNYQKDQGAHANHVSSENHICCGERNVAGTPYQSGMQAYGQQQQCMQVMWQPMLYSVNSQTVEAEPFFPMVWTGAAVNPTAEPVKRRQKKARSLITKAQRKRALVAQIKKNQDPKVSKQLESQLELLNSALGVPANSTPENSCEEHAKQQSEHQPDAQTEKVPQCEDGVIKTRSDKSHGEVISSTPISKTSQSHQNETTEVRFCGHCGGGVEFGFKFCRFCGKKQ